MNIKKLWEMVYVAYSILNTNSYVRKYKTRKNWR